MRIRLVTFRTAFYAPVIIAARLFLKSENLEGDLVFRGKPDAAESLPEGTLLIEQLAPSASIAQLAKGMRTVLIHFASINTRDGFYLVAREPCNSFALKDLEGRVCVPASFAIQPEASLRFCLQEHGVDTSKISWVRGLDGMEVAQEAFRNGRGDLVHLQDPLAEELVQEGLGQKVASIGRCQGPLSFSTLAVQPDVIAHHSEHLVTFLRAYGNALLWLSEQDPSTIASSLMAEFPGVSAEVVEAAVSGYQSMGTWPLSPVIERPHYERALEMFRQQSALTGVTDWYPYESCCNDVLATRAFLKQNVSSG